MYKDNYIFLISNRINLKIMNNAVSADVTLFSRVHPDIVKRISVSSVIVSALLAIGGIGAFVTSLRMGDATSTMSNGIYDGRYNSDSYCPFPSFLAKQRMGLHSYGECDQRGVLFL